MDYILIAQKDVEVKPNPNEVRDVKYVDQDQLKQFLEEGRAKGLKFTPWFQLVVQHFIFKWWPHLGDLSSQLDTETIHHM